MSTLLEASPEMVAPRRTDEGTQNPRAAAVKKWLKRIGSAEKKWEKKFEEMRKNMEFVAGWQWDEQKKLDDQRYINNMTLRLINQKVAGLYARNPMASVERRQRLDYQLWDGEMQSILMATQSIQQAMLVGAMPPMEALALVQDYEQGRQMEKLVEKICKTAELAYQYQVDSHKPEFKEQMKQLVRRAVICKVGYVKVRLCSEASEYSAVSTVEEPSDAKDRLARAKYIMEELQSGEIDNEAPEVEEAMSLLASLGASPAVDSVPMMERLEFDFPTSTSIIPSEECRSLKEFIAASFVAQKYKVDASLVNAIFGVDVKASDSEDEVPLPENQEKKDSTVELYEVFDIRTKTRFFVAKGFSDYVMEPEPVTPQVAGFWPIFALTFNDIEAEECTESSIFPPSDVDLIRNAQKEWNRTRDALRDQRNANAPKYVCADGTISQEDEDNLSNAKPNSVTKLKSLPPGVEPDKFIKTLQPAPIDPALYDTSPLEKDILLSSGMQEANLGPAGKDVTATVGTIAEQSRMTMLGSNIDDLDCFLSRLAQAGVELMLRGMSTETMQRIVGVGAVWPQGQADDFINEIQIKVMAASSGRPNKALELSQIQQIAPLLLQAGANPHGMVEEIVSRWDTQIDVDKFFPLNLGMMAGGSPQTASGTGDKPASPQSNLSPEQQRSGLQSTPVAAPAQ